MELFCKSTLPKGLESAITWYCNNWWSWYHDPFWTRRLINNSFKKCCTGICSSSKLLIYSRINAIILFRFARELPSASSNGQNKFEYKSASSRMTFDTVPLLSLQMIPDGNWLFTLPKTSKDDNEADNARFVCICVSRNARYSLKIMKIIAKFNLNSKKFFQWWFYWIYCYIIYLLIRSKAVPTDWRSDSSDIDQCKSTSSSSIFDP